MKAAYAALTSTLLITACSPSISKSAQVKLDKELTKENVKYHYINAKNKLETKWLKVSSHELVKKLELTDEEETKLNQSTLNARTLGAKDYNLDVEKILTNVTYNAPEDGFLQAANSYYQDQKALDAKVFQITQNKGFESKCTLRKRGFTGSYCAKYKRVKKSDFDEIVSKIKEEYTTTKTFKKDDVLKMQQYITALVTESSGDKSVLKVRVAKHKARKVASKE